MGQFRDLARNMLKLGLWGAHLYNFMALARNMPELGVWELIWAISGPWHPRVDGKLRRASYRTPGA